MNNQKSNTQFLKSFILSIFVLATSSIAQATADYYKCTNREGGEWNYGRAPNACSASAFGDDNVILQDYSPVIFQDTKERVGERKRYMEELNAVIRDAAIYYMKKRKPQVSSDELNHWVLGIMTTASQESYWSQYRSTTDGRLKMMRGDFGHGHGMMQIDDRAHFNAVEKGIAWNLASHFAYGMDIFYAAWERAPKQSCVKSPTDYMARIRSAWSAYNGGPSKICRWSNPFDSWAKNDKNFYNQLSSKRWQTFIADQNKPSKVNIGCLIENTTNCANPDTPTDVEPEALVEGQLYTVNDSRACVLAQGVAHCVQEQRDRLCLLALQNFNSENTRTTTVEILNNYTPRIWDRHQLCAQYDSTLFKVGDSIKTRKNINIRTAPGSGVLGIIPANSVLSVVDFEVRSQSLKERYYKVQYKTWTGYIFGGNKGDYNQWASLNVTTQPVASVAKASQTVKIVSASGINLRATPGGSLLTLVPKGTVTLVEEVVIKNTDNEIYYRVTYNGKTGYIYSGKLLPQDTVKTWTVVQP